MSHDDRNPLEQLRALHARRRAERQADEVPGLSPYAGRAGDDARFNDARLDDTQVVDLSQAAAPEPRSRPSRRTAVGIGAAAALVLAAVVAGSAVADGGQAAGPGVPLPSDAGAVPAAPPGRHARPESPAGDSRGTKGEPESSHPQRRADPEAGGPRAAADAGPAPS